MVDAVSKNNVIISPLRSAVTDAVASVRANRANPTTITGNSTAVSKPSPAGLSALQAAATPDANLPRGSIVDKLV